MNNSRPLPRRLASLVLGAFALVALPAMADVDHYAIDSDHTFASFEYSHWGLSRQQGRFNHTSGYIELDRAAGSGKVDIEIATDSVDAGSSLFDDTLRSSIFFDATTYPKISFVSTALHFNGDSLTQVEGTLTIKGITKPVTLEITQFTCRFMLIYGKQACGANGFAKILRSDYKLGSYVPFVSDEVMLYVAVEAIKDNGVLSTPDPSSQP